MSWMGKLCETYDYAIARGADSGTDNPLPEIGFKIENVQAKICLSKQGEFMDIKTIPKDEQSMPVPATPDSITARGSPVKPHPIFDKIKELCSQEQLSILSEWCDEDDCPEDVRIIYSYLIKRSLLADVKKAFEENGIKNDPEKLFVSFIISTELTSSEEFRKSWTKHFIKLCQNQAAEYCYVTGRNIVSAKKHPFAFGTTMLVSMVGGKCSGRFESDAEKAVSIGLETTLKAHSARRWLMNRQGKNLYYGLDKFFEDRQGKNLYGMEFVAWDTRDFDVVSPIDSYDYSFEAIESISTGEVDSKALARAAGGTWSAKMKELSEEKPDELSTIVIMVVDSPMGKGRASITYYQEFEPKVYIDNLMHWYSGCVWERYNSHIQRNVGFIPSIISICDLIFGERDDPSITKLKKHLCRELIPCITAKKPLPQNVIALGFNRVITPFSFKTDDNKWSSTKWEKSVSILCALMNMKTKEKGEYVKMVLDEKENNRDYLYGRLLAVADTIEYLAMKKASDSSGRMTNAMQYMQRFVQRPADTWLMLRTQKLMPYLNRLNAGSRIYYENLINEIQGLIDTEGYTSEKPLGPLFLQGYSLQKLSKSISSDKTENEE